jgi:hypothetical protein
MTRPSVCRLQAVQRRLHANREAAPGGQTAWRAIRGGEADGQDVESPGELRAGNGPSEVRRLD